MSTSWFSAGVGDVVAVAKLAAILYKKCYVDIKEAPEEFQLLVEELRILKLALKNLRDDIGIVERQEPDRRKETLARCYRACARDLERLNEIVDKYFQVVDGDRLNFWKKFGFGKRQNEISTLRHRLRGHQVIITSCLGSIQNQLLDRIAQGLLPALEQGELIIHPHRNVSGTSYPSQALAGTPLNSASNSDVNSGERSSFAKSSVQNQPSPSPFRNHSIYASPTQSESPSWPSAPVVSAEVPNSIRQYEFDPADYGAPASSDDENSSNDDTGDDLDIATEMDEVCEALSSFRRKMRASQPLHLPNRQRIISIPDEVKATFQHLAEDALSNCELSTIGWLRLATWWLMKSRCIGRSADEWTASSYRSSSRGDTILPPLQAYINLLKATWILFDVVLSEQYEYPLTFREKLFNDLCEGITHEFRLFRPDCPFSTEDLLADIDTLNIFEPMSTAELRDSTSLEDLSRWVTVEAGDAGCNGEGVLSRTFADAAIGRGGRTVYDKGAPYLLLISSQDGESEPRITICNQTGTWSLSRVLTVEDVDRFCLDANPASSDDYFVQPRYVHLEFDKEEVSIKFLSDTNLNAFIHKPKRYFEAVSSRQPRETPNTAEVEIFRCSLTSVRELHPSSMDVIDGREFKSCHLRVLEQRENVTWRSHRRLVLSSSVAAAQSNFWCSDYFLPMDHVQIKPTDIYTLAVKWSDCSHEDFETTDGNYHTLFTHFYNAARPNNAFEFIFGDESKADEFQNAILSLHRPRLFEWHNKGRDLETIGGVAYEVQDSDPRPIKYRAITVRRQRLDWAYARVIYCYRNFDYCFDGRMNHIWFPEIHYTHYLSNHVEMNYRPQDAPAFSACQKNQTELTIDFSSKHEAQEFLSSLSTHRLIYAGFVRYTSTKSPRKIGRTRRSNEGCAEIQVWKLRDSLRIASRWGNVTEKWLTFSVKPNEVARQGDLVWIERKSYRQGKYLNLLDIEAYGPKSTNRQSRLTYGFGSGEEAAAFDLALSQGLTNGPKGTGTGLESMSFRTDTTSNPSL